MRVKEGAKEERKQIMSKRNVKTITLRSFVTVVFACACLVSSPTASGILPPPDGCYLGYTTAEGCNALESLTTGIRNTAVGWYSLFANSEGSYNTAVGAGALYQNVAGYNSAVGAAALNNNI